MKSKCAVLLEPGRFEIEQIELAPKDDELLVRVEVCGLCNWELNHWHGKLGTFPQTLGHEWAGIVVAAGKDVDGFKKGDKVTGLPKRLGGFAEYCTVPADLAIKLSAEVKLKEALGEPLKCIITVLNAAAPQAADHGVVVGCGSMGLWCIQSLRGGGLATLVAVDTDDDKLALAKHFGATHTVNPNRQSAEALIRSVSGGHMADFVIEGTGIPAVLNTCVPYLKAGGRGRLVLMSSHEEPCGCFDFREAIKRSIEIRVAHPGYPYDPMDDLRRAVIYLQQGVFSMDKIITHTYRLEDIQAAFTALEHKPHGYIKGIVITAGQ